MHDFGVLTGQVETFLLRDADGEVIGVSPPVMVLYDDAGVRWQTLFSEHPHPWYIAVTDDNLVCSLESDPEHSQIAGTRIIGIDSDFGFTRGAGGTVYGKKWTGSAIVEA